MRTAKDFRDQAIEELESNLVDLRKTLFEYLNQRAQEKKTDKPHLARHLKKEIARLLTVLKEKKSA